MGTPRRRRPTCRICLRAVARWDYCGDCHALLRHLGRVHEADTTPRFDPLPELRRQRVEWLRRRLGGD